MRKLIWVVFAAVLAGCGQQSQSGSAVLPPVGTSTDGVVVKARSSITIATGTQSPSLISYLFALSTAYAASSTVPVSTTVSSSTTYTLDSSLFSVPASPTPFVVNDFGFLQISALKDNDLDSCGNNGKTHCGTAMIRMYTSGTAGAGLWNSVDQYGAPIDSAQSGVAPQLSVGLNEAGAAVLEQVTIPGNKHVIMLSDFSNPKYDVSVDFTNAGAGAYSTTLVLEYALSQ